MSKLLSLSLLLLLTSPVTPAVTDCPILQAAELGSNTSSVATGLLAEALSSQGQGGAGTYQLVDFNIVCLAQGSGKDLYRMVSVIVSYIRDSTTPATTQFHYECVNNQWSISVFGSPEHSVSRTALVGTLTTMVRRDCQFCLDDFLVTSAAEHCAGKNSSYSYYSWLTEKFYLAKEFVNYNYCLYCLQPLH